MQDDNPTLPIISTRSRDQYGTMIHRRQVDAQLENTQVSISIQGPGTEQDQVQVRVMDNDSSDSYIVTGQANGFGFVEAHEAAGNGNKALDRDSAAAIARLGKALLDKNNVRLNDVSQYASDTMDRATTGMQLGELMPEIEREKATEPPKRGRQP